MKAATRARFGALSRFLDWCHDVGHIPANPCALKHRQSATRGGVLGVYQRASRWPEQVRAMQLWGRLLTDAIDGRTTCAEAVPLAAVAC